MGAFSATTVLDSHYTIEEPATAWSLVPYPSATFHCFVRKAGDWLIASHTERTVTAAEQLELLGMIGEGELQASIRATNGFIVSTIPLPKRFGHFWALLILRPATAKYYITAIPRERGPEVAARTFNAFPVYRCEICHDEREDELLTRVKSNGLLPYSSPDREPFPALAMRYKHVHPRPIVSAGGHKMGIFAWKDVVERVGALESAGGFVQLENWERHFVRIAWDQEYILTWGNTTRRLDPVKMNKWLRGYAFTGIAAAWEAVGIDLPADTNTSPVTVAPLDHALRAICSSTSGSPTPASVKELYNALRGAGQLETVCLKTASHCVVDPEVSPEAKGRILARLALPKTKGERGPSPASRRDVAEACVHAAIDCVIAPSARKFDDMLRTYERCQFQGELDPERLEDFWNAWLEDVVLTAPSSNVAQEVASLREALDRSFLPIEPASWLEGTGDENDQFFVEAVDARRRSLAEIAVARLAPSGRKLRVTIQSRDGTRLGRARAVYYARHVLLRSFLHEFYRDRYDVLEVSEAADVWRV